MNISNIQLNIKKNQQLILESMTLESYTLKQQKTSKIYFENKLSDILEKRRQLTKNVINSICIFE